MNPGTDEFWILNEPVGLPSHANALVADFTAKYYAEGMTLLFSPDDGLFEGGGWRIADQGDTSVSGLRAKVKLIAERRWVAACTVSPFCPATILHRWVGKDVERINPARLRCGLPVLTTPSVTTIQRWGREFGETHANRDGIAERWRNYRPV